MGFMRVPPVPGNARTNAVRNLKSQFLILLVIGVLPAVDLLGQTPQSSPFSPRSQPEGSTLFTELSPARTGIVTTNNYDDPRMWLQRHREYSLGGIGSGVAIGDYDADGRPDVFIQSKIESGRLFRNLGDWRFEDVTVAAGLEDKSGIWKQGVSFVDIDNDGLLDLYLCRLGAPNQLFMNNGDGTFREEAKQRGLAVEDGSGMGCFADYDRDGWLDLYLQTNLLDASENLEGRPDYLFRNRGDGTFENVTRKAGISTQATQGHSATWWDYDEDGWLDLYVANDFAPADFLYRNNKDGTFSNVVDSVVPHMPYSSMGSDIGDVNNDGRIDFFVADMAGSTIEKEHRGQSDSRARIDPNQNEQVNVAVQNSFNALYLNTGTGRMLEVASLAGVLATDWTWSTRFEDLNSDGRLDLFVTNGMEREQNNLDLIEKRMLAISPHRRIGILKTSPVFAEENFVFVNEGALHFKEVGEEWGLNKEGVSFGTAFGDLDGDGDLDLVFVNYQEGPSVLRNDSTRGNNVVIELRGAASNRYGLGARLKLVTQSSSQVRQLLSARGYLSTSEPMVHFGLGEESEIERLEIFWPSGRKQVLDTLEGGRKYVIAEPSESPSWDKGFENRDSSPIFQEASRQLGINVTQREERLEGTMQQAGLPRRFNRRGPAIAVGNLNGGERDEIVFGGTSVDGVQILSTDSGVYRKLDTGNVGADQLLNDGPPLIFDANGDGLNDLLLTGGGAAIPAEEPEYEPRLWFGDGRGNFKRAPEGYLPSLPISVGAAVAADFNRDGRLDLFLGGRLYPGYYPEACNSALLLQSDGRMKDETRSFAPEFEALGLVTAAVASDVDKDGWVDLVVALEWGGVHCFRNVEGESFEDVSKDWGFDSSGSGLWNSIESADFNGDGRMDFALGNLGLNTLFTSNHNRSLKLYYADFAESGGEPQIVLAYDDEGTLKPVASRSELAAKIPQVLERFPSNDQFAAATLDEILGEAALEAAMVLEANEFRSGVLLSGEPRQYVFSPLPRLAQVAPIQGMTSLDFDGDGNSDLLVATNDYSPIAQFGRFDGGLGCLLRGDGLGGFVVVPPTGSGWVVPGNAKSLALADLDGDFGADVVVARNNERALAFINTADDTLYRYQIRLKGRDGNPDGVGARVEVLENGLLRSLFEVKAGFGFASQSSPSLFLAVKKDNTPNIQLQVRWASGKTSKHELPSEGGELEVSE